MIRRLLNSVTSLPITSFRPRLSAVAAAMVMLGMGCGDPTAPPEPVATVTIAPSSVVLLVPGGTEQLVPSPKGASGKELTGREAVWSTSDASTVSVSGGLITGVVKGTATITVSIEGKTASVDVEVRDGAVVTVAGASFSLFENAVSVAVPAGAVTQTRNISVKPSASSPAARRFVLGTAYDFGPEGAVFQAPVTITIKYDPTKVAPDSPESGLQLYEVAQGAWHVVAGSTVDVSAHAVSGNVTHFSTYGVLMQPIVDTVRVVGPAGSMAVKTNFQFTAVVKDSAGETLTRPITWTSSAPAALQIDPVSGAASALALGTAVITATSETKSGTATVTVVPGPPAHMLRVTSESVIGAAGVALATPPAVKVTDESGNGITGFAVTFAVVTGGGSVTGGATTTNANGVASPASWILGTTAGSNTITATGAGLPESPMTFTAIGNPGPAATIAANSATSLTGTAGGLVATLPSVKVSDAFGNAVPGVTVVFAPTSGSGSVSGGNAATNSSGIATVGEWRLGTTSGNQTLEATLSGASGSPVTFTAVAAAPVPSSMVIVEGNGQTAVTLSAVSVAPAVRITDPAGVPVPGVTVTFAVTGGGGSISGASATTNADGVATLGSWILGPSPGENAVSASALSLTSVTFTATAVAPTPVAISIVAGQNQTSAAGAPVPVPPSVKVTDDQGRGVPGIAVTFSITSGGGSITGGNAVTNSSGIATVGSWILGVGSNSLSAASPGLAGSPITFIATGVAFVQVVTFGDSNTDRGYQGTDPTIRASSYVSSDATRLGPNDPNNPLQLAGKIETRWRASRSETIKVVNHGIVSTRTGTGRTGLTSPNALEVVHGLTRFEGEALGLGYPWSGGETANAAFPNGAILRVQAFQPRASADFVYVSLGTNDLITNVNTDSIAANLSLLVDRWVAAGLPTSHFIITTLPPGDAPTSIYVPGMNVAIRRVATQRSLRLIDLVTFCSNDNGSTWKSASLHLNGDLLHYSEAVRTWLADRVFDIINAP